MPRRSILFASLMNGLPWGGSEELWYRTALHAAREGHEVACVVYPWEERRSRYEAIRAAGARVYEMPNGGHGKRTLVDTVRFEMATKVLQRAALAAIPFEKYEVAVMNQGGCQEVAAPEWWGVRRRLGRYAILFHNFVGPLAISSRRCGRLASWAAGAAANMFAADEVRTNLEATIGRTIPNASVLVNPITFAPPERPIPLPPGPPWRFAVLAALEFRSKAQDALVQALARPEWSERSFELSLFGAGRDEPVLADLVRRSGLSAKVRLEGHTTDVLGAIRAAHVVLQLTRIDAMPLSVMEAMAVGRPVAVTRLGDMPVWVRPGENGWVAPDCSPESISAALEQVWASRDAWAAMGERSHRIFHERCPVLAEQRLLDALSDL